MSQRRFHTPAPVVPAPRQVAEPLVVDRYNKPLFEQLSPFGQQYLRDSVGGVVSSLQSQTYDDLRWKTRGMKDFDLQITLYPSDPRVYEEREIWVEPEARASTIWRDASAGPWKYSGRRPWKDYGVQKVRVYPVGDQLHMRTLRSNTAHNVDPNWYCCGQPESTEGCWFGRPEDLKPYDALVGIHGVGRDEWNTQNDFNIAWDRIQVGTPWIEPKYYKELDRRIKKLKADARRGVWRLFSDEPVDDNLFYNLGAIIRLENEYNEVHGIHKTIGGSLAQYRTYFMQDFALSNGDDDFKDFPNDKFRDYPENVPLPDDGDDSLEFSEEVADSLEDCRTVFKRMILMSEGVLSDQVEDKYGDLKNFSACLDQLQRLFEAFPKQQELVDVYPEFFVPETANSPSNFISGVRLALNNDPWTREGEYFYIAYEDIDPIQPNQLEFVALAAALYSISKVLDGTSSMEILAQETARYTYMKDAETFQTYFEDPERLPNQIISTFPPKLQVYFKDVIKETLEDGMDITKLTDSFREVVQQLENVNGMLIDLAIPKQEVIDLQRRLNEIKSPYELDPFELDVARLYAKNTEWIEVAWPSPQYAKVISTLIDKAKTVRRVKSLIKDAKEDIETINGIRDDPDVQKWLEDVTVDNVKAFWKFLDEYDESSDVSQSDKGKDEESLDVSQSDKGKEEESLNVSQDEDSDEESQEDDADESNDMQEVPVPPEMLTREFQMARTRAVEALQRLEGWTKLAFKGRRELATIETTYKMEQFAQNAEEWVAVVTSIVELMDSLGIDERSEVMQRGMSTVSDPKSMETFRQELEAMQTPSDSEEIVIPSPKDKEELQSDSEESVIPPPKEKEEFDESEEVDETEEIDDRELMEDAKSNVLTYIKRLKNWTRLVEYLENEMLDIENAEDMEMLAVLANNWIVVTNEMDDMMSNLGDMDDEDYAKLVASGHRTVYDTQTSDSFRLLLEKNLAIWNNPPLYPTKEIEDAFGRRIVDAKDERSLNVIVREARNAVNMMNDLVEQGKEKWIKAAKLETDDDLVQFLFDVEQGGPPDPIDMQQCVNIMLDYVSPEHWERDFYLFENGNSDLIHEFKQCQDTVMANAKDLHKEILLGLGIGNDSILEIPYGVYKGKRMYFWVDVARKATYMLMGIYVVSERSGWVNMTLKQLELDIFAKDEKNRIKKNTVERIQQWVYNNLKFGVTKTIRYYVGEYLNDRHMNTEELADHLRQFSTGDLVRYLGNLQVEIPEKATRDDFIRWIIEDTQSMYSDQVHGGADESPSSTLSTTDWQDLADEITGRVLYSKQHYDQALVDLTALVRRIPDASEADRVLQEGLQDLVPTESENIEENWWHLARSGQRTLDQLHLDELQAKYLIPHGGVLTTLPNTVLQYIVDTLGIENAPTKRKKLVKFLSKYNSNAVKSILESIESNASFTNPNGDYKWNAIDSVIIHHLNCSLVIHWDTISSNATWEPIFKNHYLHPDMSLDVKQWTKDKQTRYLHSLSNIAQVFEHMDRTEPISRELYDRCNAEWPIEMATL